MERTRNIRRILLTVLALLFASVFTIAVIQVFPAKADDLVLDGNTATFTVENDMTKVDQNDDTRWTYDRETNEWSSSKDLPNPDKGTSIKLTVVEPGNMVFSWKVGSQYDNSAVLITKTRAGEDPTEIVSVKELSSSSEWKEYASYSSPVTISGLQTGDVVEFKWTASVTYSSSSHYMMIKGLNPPANKFPITAKVTEDCIDHGTIKTEKSEETFDESGNQLIAQRGYCESVTFTAVPADGYTAYWKDSNGKIVSHVATLEIAGINESNNNTTYTAYFVKLGEDGTKISFDDPIDGKAYFTKSEQGDEYSVADIKNLGEEDKIALYIEFTGEKYVAFDRAMVKANRLSALSDSCYVDNDKISIPDGAENINFHVTGEGYHVIKIIVSFSSFGSSIDGGPMTPSSIQDGDSYTVKNIRFQDKDHPFEESITVKYNPHYSDLYLNEDRQEAEDVNAIIEKKITVPLADEYTIEIKPKTSVVSSMDPSQMAEVVYKNSTANAQYFKSTNTGYKQTYPEFQSQSDGSVKLTISRFALQYSINAKLDGRTMAHDFTLDEGAEFLELTFNYMERAPIPKVSAIKTIDNEETEIESIADGQVIDFPFLHNNSLSLRIQKIEGLEQTDFSVLVNNVERNASLQDYENIFLLPIQDVGNTEVVIRYLKSSETIDFSAYSLSFRLGEFPEEDKNGTDFEQVIHLDENSGNASLRVTVTDRVSYNRPAKWLFDPELSAEGNYAYTTTSQVNPNSGYYRGESNVKVLMFELLNEAQGSLTFQFRASGYIGQEVLGGSYRGGLLYAAPYSSYYDLYMNHTKYCESSDGITWTDPDPAVTLLAKPRPEGGMEYGSTVVPLEDGWYQASVPIKKDMANNVVLLFLTCYPTNSSYPIDQIPIASASIRDVRVVTGEKTVSVSTSAEAGDATATVTVGDTQHHNGDESFKVNAGTMVNLSADTKGKKFYGWSVNGQLVSTEQTASIFINADSVIKAWIADEGTYEARTEGTFYTSIVEAVNAANSGQTVIVIKDGTSIETSFEIKAGVTLLLPYSDENRLTATGTPDVNSKDKIAWIADSATYRYLTVTVKGNVTITVSGTLAVGGIVNYPKGQGYQGHTSGAYSELILEKGSSIQVAKGGVMDVYGRVWGGEGHEGTDMGTIDVADGGKLYQPFLILDYTGGSNALGLFMAGQTPFRRYAMINIEVPTTINYGGMLYGHASLWIETFKMLASLDQPFVSYYMGEKLGGDGNGNDTFVMLHDGASVTITYDPTKVIGSPTTADCTEGIGKIKMVFEGGADFSYMLFSAMGISVPTNSVYFSIPYNYEVEMNDFAAPQGDVHAQYETKTDFMIMPGAIVKVGKNATLTLSANTWIYDGLEQNKLSGKGYPTATQLNGIYSKSGNLIVDGTLKIGQKTTVQQFELFEPAEPFVPKIIPALFLGIIQTNGTGTIIVPEGTELSGQIVDGANGTNYFAYTTTARLYDAAHGILTPLVPEGETKISKAQTYTATGGAAFKLESFKYTNAEGGAESETLTLSSDMVGSWKVDHEDHVEPAWEYDANKDGTVKPNEVKQLTRYCTELGCDHAFHRYLIGSPTESVGALTYRGGTFSAEEVEALIQKYYTNLNGLEAFPAGVEFSVSEDGLKSAINADSYTVTVTLNDAAGGGFFLGEGGFVYTNSVQWTIEAFDLSKEGYASATAKSASVIYNGEAQEVGVQQVMAYLSKEGGVDGALNVGDYEISYSADTTNVGTVTITITGKGNYTGSVTCTYEIAKRALNVTIDSASHTYGETPQEALTVTVSGEVAGQTSDIKAAFTLTAKDATQWANAGSYAITADYNAETGVLKNYEVNVTNATNTAYEITAKDIAAIEVKFNKTYTYDRKAQQPLAGDLTVTLAGYEGHAVTFTVGGYQNNIDAGSEASLVVTGTENFTGTKTVKFTIEKATIDKVTVDGSYTYNAKDQTDTVKNNLTVMAGSLTLRADEYTVTFAKGEESTVENAGTYTVTVTTTDKNFKTTDTVTTEFTVEKAKVTVKAENKNSPEKQKLVQLTFTIDGYLEEDDKLEKAIAITVAEGAEEGTANQEFAITVAFKQGSSAEDFANYEITFEKGTYTITAAVFANVTFASGSAVYDRKAHTHTATLGQPADKKTGTFSAQYTYAIKDGAPVEEMKEAGIYTVTLELTFTVSESEKYTTTLTSEYTITAAQIGTVTVHEGDFIYTGKAIEPTLTVMSANDLTLTAEEYTVSYGTRGNIDAGDVTVTVTPKSKNFAGSGSANFTIKTKDIGEAEVSVTKDYTYCGKEIVPAQGDVTVTLGDFVVTFNISASNNIDAGDKAVVTVTGTGNYSGTATANFTIVAKEITVNILGQTLTYSGTEKLVLDDSKWTTTGLEERDDTESLKVTLSLDEKKWEVGTHTGVIAGNWNNTNYTVTFVKGDLTITAREVTVRIEDKSSQYGDTYAALTFAVDEKTPLAAGDEKEALGVTLTFAGSAGSRLSVNTYPITGKADGKNYHVTFTGSNGEAGTYTVVRREVTITILAESEIYDNREFAASQEENVGWEVTQGSILEGDRLNIVLTKEAGKTAGEYPITGKFENANYNVTFVDGTFTVAKRPVSVVIENQSTVYRYTYGYILNGDKWRLAEESSFASGEERTVLGVTLKTATLTDAGIYAITGEWNNDNYAVTFLGEYEGEGEANGHAGKYTIAKQDVTDDAIFILGVEERDFTSEGLRTIRTTYANEALTLFCTVTYYEDVNGRELRVEISPKTLGAVGNFTVHVEIADTNYSGSADFEVIVTDEAGFTQNLREVLEKLEALAAGLGEELTAEDYETLLGIREAIYEDLDETEREVGAAELAEYEAYLAAWEELTDIDDIVDTAKAIANAPISALFEAAATLTALIGLAYIGLKGGILR